MYSGEMNYVDNCDLLLSINGLVSDNIISGAIRGGHLDLVKSIYYGNDVKLTHLLCNDAALYGRLDILKWLRKKQCPWESSMQDSASEGGHLDILKWAVDNGYKCTGLVYRSAAQYGHMHILEWAYANNYGFDNYDICGDAVRGGQLDILKWLRQRNCPWDYDVCLGAASRGYIDIIKWAHENGCPCSTYTYICAIENNQLDILKWLYENGYEIPENSYDYNMHKLAADTGNPDMIEWVSEHL